MAENLMSEKEKQKVVANFEKDMRKNFEANLERQKQSLESVLKGENPTSLKARQIVFACFDTGTLLPLYLFAFDVDEEFNGLVLAHSLIEKQDEFFKSKQFWNIQKKMYYRLRKSRVKPSEIYPQLEPRWEMMDSKERTALRDKLTKDFGRKIAKKARTKQGK